MELFNENVIEKVKFLPTTVLSGLPAARKRSRDWWRADTLPPSLFSPHNTSGTVETRWSRWQISFGYLHDPESDSIRRHDIPDTAVAGTFNPAALNHIPDCDMPPQKHLLFLQDCLRHWFFHQCRNHLPESVLRMMVIKLSLSGLHRGKSPQNQNFGFLIKNRRKFMKNLYIFSPVHQISLLPQGLLQVLLE